jgi:hypothetical protein
VAFAPDRAENAQLVIGLGNTVIDFGVFTFSYKVLELPLVASNLLAWLFAVSGSYVMNEHNHHLSGRVGPCLERQGLPALRRLRRPRGDRDHHHTGGAVSLSAGDHGEADLHHHHHRRLAFNFTMLHFIVFRPRVRPEEMQTASHQSSANLT